MGQMLRPAPQCFNIIIDAQHLFLTLQLQSYMKLLKFQRKTVKIKMLLLHLVDILLPKKLLTSLLSFTSMFITSQVSMAINSSQDKYGHKFVCLIVIIIHITYPLLQSSNEVLKIVFRFLERKNDKIKNKKVKGRKKTLHE